MSQNKIPSKEDFGEWLDNPITLAYLQMLKEEAIAWRDQTLILDVSEDFKKLGQQYFINITTARLYENVLNNLTYENLFFQEELENVETSGESSSD